jgi:hypothetical protein
MPVMCIILKGTFISISTHQGVNIYSLQHNAGNKQLHTKTQKYHPKPLTN